MAVDSEPLLRETNLPGKERQLHEDPARLEGLHRPVDDGRRGPALAEPALRVLRKRFPGSPDPLAEWLPSEPLWMECLPDLEVLEDELLKLRRSGGKIVLYGHDDMDGMTGLFVGKRLLSMKGFEVVPVIPDRAVEDYGILPSRLEGLLGRGDLLLTVDSGCSSVAGVRWAIEKGARVVVTDHHTLNPPLPPAHGLIDPQRTGFPGTVLAGCGVLFASLCELFDDVRDDAQALAAVALGTVSDRVPLLAWNRYLVHRFSVLDESELTQGLRLLARTWPNRTGHWSASSVRQQITSVIGKGLNSGIGRILEFMESEDGESCLAAWSEMSAQSDSRSQMVSEVLSRAMNEKDPEADAFGMVLVFLGDTQPGMGGTLASKLCRIFRRGTIVVGRRPDGMLVGEARSLGDWNMAGFLVSLGKVFTSAGGHARAAGFSAEAMSWPELRNHLVSHMSTYPTNPVPEPHVDFESETLPAAADLVTLAPFGPDFPPPAVKVGGMRYLLQIGPTGPAWCISEESGE